MNLSDDLGQLFPPTTGTQDAARRHVAAHATDPTDLHTLLDMLGLAGDNR